MYNNKILIIAFGFICILSVSSSTRELPLIGPSGETILGLGTLSGAIYLPDGQRIVVYGSLGIYIWNIQTKEVERVFYSDHVLRAAISADGKKLIATTGYESILWNLETSSVIHKFSDEQSSYVNTVAISPDGEMIAMNFRLSNRNSSVFLYEADSGQLLHEFAHQEDTSSLLEDIARAEFSPNSKMLLTDNGFYTFSTQGIRIWDVSTGQELHDFENAQFGTFSPDGNIVLSDSNGTVRFIDAVTGEENHRFTLPVSPISFQISQDGRLVLAKCEDDAGEYAVILWDWTVDREIQRFGNFPFWIRPDDYVSFSPDETQVMVLGGGQCWDSDYDPQFIEILNANTGERICVMDDFCPNVHSLAYSPDGNYLASGGKDTLHLWDACTGERIHKFERYPGGIYAVAFTPDGEKIVAGYWAPAARVWDVKAGELFQTLTVTTDTVISISFSPDGERIAMGGHKFMIGPENQGIGSVEIRNFQTGEILLAYPRYGAVFSPDGASVLMMGGDYPIELINAFDGTLVRTFTGGAAAFSPDGSKVLTGNDTMGGPAKIWDAKTGALLLSLYGHDDWVFTIAVSPDGTKALTGSYDKTAKLWDMESGELIQTFAGHTNFILAVAFSPDGKQIATGGEDGTVRIWDISNLTNVAQWCLY